MINNIKKNIFSILINLITGVITSSFLVPELFFYAVSINTSFSILNLLVIIFLCYLCFVPLIYVFYTIFKKQESSKVVSFLKYTYSIFLSPLFLFSLYAFVGVIIYGGIKAWVFIELYGTISLLLGFMLFSFVKLESNRSLNKKKYLYLGCLVSVPMTYVVLAGILEMNGYYYIDSTIYKFLPIIISLICAPLFSWLLLYLNQKQAANKTFTKFDRFKEK